jgi:hypothetical protein
MPTVNNLESNMVCAPEAGRLVEIADAFRGISEKKIYP